MTLERMLIFRWNLKSVGEIPCSWLWHSKKWNTTNSKTNFPGGEGQAKKLFSFRKLWSQNFFHKDSLFESKIILHKFHLDPMLWSWDPAYRKILGTPLLRRKYLSECVTAKLTNITYRPPLACTDRDRNIQILRYV